MKGSVLSGGRERFSKRFGHQPQEAEITIREDAPDDLRYAVLAIAKDKCGLSPSDLRSVLCSVLRKRPDPSNWSEYPNIWEEVQDLIHRCEWFRVYDIVEAIHDYLAKRCKHKEFDANVNASFGEMGIGWQLTDGAVEVRGERAFETVVAKAEDSLDNAALPTAKNELAEAIHDMSRRPKPDLSGAVHHAVAALECVAREVTGDPRHTLGEIVKKSPGLFPKPLDDAVSKCWGYSSETARHAREGRELEYEEAQLMVGLSAVLATYLTHKLSTEES